MTKLTPKIIEFSSRQLIGKKLMMSFVRDRTRELWESFAPKLKTLPQKSNGLLYSVQIYPDPTFFNNFQPTREFEKWAAVELIEPKGVPAELDILTLPAGLYAVFHYIGKPSEAQATFQHIFGEWLPHSSYELDHRPHFALMGDKYKGEEPDSEEDSWIPIK